MISVKKKRHLSVLIHLFNIHGIDRFLQPQVKYPEVAKISFSVLTRGNHTMADTYFARRLRYLAQWGARNDLNKAL